MPLFDSDEYDGSLAELIERCLEYVPAAEMLAAADRWLEGLERQGRLLPVRKFARHTARGEVFAVGGRRFVPVDNETLAHIYRDLLSGTVPEGDLETLYRNGALTVSWKLDGPALELGPRVRRGQVASDFRDAGLKLAHIVDAARGINGLEVADFVQRFRLTLNPLNCFPFPSSRRYRFEPVDGFADPGESPRVQAILAGALAEHAGPAFSDYRGRVGGNRPVASPWREAAERIRIAFSPRRMSPRTGTPLPQLGAPEDQGDLDAITPRANPLRCENLCELIDTLRQWRRAHPSAERLNGHRTFLRKSPNTGRESVVKSDPKPYVYFNITPDCALDVPTTAIRKWHLNGDTKVEAIDELIATYDAQDTFDGLFRLETVKTSDKLVLQGRDASCGLYCYG